MRIQELEFIKFALNDNDFKDTYLKYKPDLAGFEELVKQVANYCFNNDYFNPYLDKEYLDCCYLKVDDKIINLDDIYEVFKEYLLED